MFECLLTRSGITFAMAGGVLALYVSGVGPIMLLMVVPALKMIVLDRSDKKQQTEADADSRTDGHG